MTTRIGAQPDPSRAALARLSKPRAWARSLTAMAPFRPKKWRARLLDSWLQGSPTYAIFAAKVSYKRVIVSVALHTRCRASRGRKSDPKEYQRKARCYMPRVAECMKRGDARRAKQCGVAQERIGRSGRSNAFVSLRCGR